jgi:hypothetical protein
MTTQLRPACRCGCSLDLHPIQPGGTSNCVRCPSCVHFAVPGTRAAREAEQSERDRATGERFDKDEPRPEYVPYQREYYPEEDEHLGLSAVGVRWQQDQERHEEELGP